MVCFVYTCMIFFANGHAKPAACVMPVSGTGLRVMDSLLASQGYVRYMFEPGTLAFCQRQSCSHRLREHCTTPGYAWTFHRWRTVQTIIPQ